MGVYAPDVRLDLPVPTPARATGSRSPPTSAAATAFDRAIADFADAYADQNERDYAAAARRSATAGSTSSARLIDGRPTLFGPLRVEKDFVGLA